MIQIVCDTKEEERRIKNKLAMFGACKLTCRSTLPCYNCNRGKMQVTINTKERGYIGGTYNDCWNN